MNRYTISEAAKLLGVTHQAIHNRINRGKIRHERDEDGKQFVYLTDDELDKQSENRLPNGFLTEYIATLKQEIEDWKEESRRKDHLLAAALERIPQLEAPQDTPPETAESAVTPAEEEGKGSVSPEGEKPSWWRRLLQ